MNRLVVALLIAASSAVCSASPDIDFSGVQESLAGDPTRVLTLGTVHIGQQDEDTLPVEHLSLLLDKLEAFAPDVIAIEGLPGETCDHLGRFSETYPDVWDRYCIDPKPALDSLELSAPRAAGSLWSTLRDKDGAWTAAERRRLAALYIAAGNPYSAVVQWRALPSAERVVGDGVDAAVLAVIEERMASRNESNSIGAVLAHRLGHDQVWPMDDHTADKVIARASENPYEVLSEHVWANMPAEAIEHYEKGIAMFGSPEGVIRAYRHLNSKRSQELTIAADFGAAAAHSAVTRQYVSWWQVRGLRMAANVLEAAGNRPGARVLVIVGASHKAYFDAYLDQMHDIELVSVEDVLSD